MIWYDIIWYIVWYDMIWYNIVQLYDVMWCDVVWCGVWEDQIWFDFNVLFLMLGIYISLLVIFGEILWAWRRSVLMCLRYACMHMHCTEKSPDRAVYWLVNLISIWFVYCWLERKCGWRYSQSWSTRRKFSFFGGAGFNAAFGCE